MAKRLSGTHDGPAEKANSGDASDIDADILSAKTIALAARNGVEDLHAAGAFSDQQAPSLNRRIRARIYEVLLARRLSQPGSTHDPFARYIADLTQGQKGGRGIAALQAAVARAVDDFSASEAIDDATAKELREAAIDGAVEAYRVVTRLGLGRSKNEEHDRRALYFWLMSVPDYWEKPEVSPEFQKLLDRRNAPGPKRTVRGLDPDGGMS